MLASDGYGAPLVSDSSASTVPSYEVPLRCWMTGALLTVSFMLVVVSFATGASATQVRKLKRDLKANTFMLQENVRKGILGVEVKRKALLEAGDLRAVRRRADASLEHTKVQLKKLASASKKIEEQAEELARQGEELERKKEALEERARFLSMGFYTSLSAAVIAFAGLLFRIPTARLDRRLRRLEILEKEQVLKATGVEITSK